MTRNKLSLPNNDCDTLGIVWRSGRSFCIDTGLDLDQDPLDYDTLWALQHELVYHQQVRLCTHQVWCDASKLRASASVHARLGYYVPADNTVHLFEYVPLDSKYPEGVYALKTIGAINPGSVYHEVGHSFNYRCILIYHADQSYDTWALDELMASTRGWLAVFSDMPEISGRAISVHTNYTPGTSFQKRIARRIVESALDEGLFEINCNRRQYENAWLEYESQPEPNLIQTRTSNTAEAWRHMRTVLVHGHPMDVYDCIRPTLRREMDKLIHVRPRVKRTGR